MTVAITHTRTESTETTIELDAVGAITEAVRHLTGLEDRHYRDDTQGWSTEAAELLVSGIVAGVDDLLDEGLHHAETLRMIGKAAELLDDWRSNQDDPE